MHNLPSLATNLANLTRNLTRMLDCRTAITEDRFVPRGARVWVLLVTKRVPVAILIPVISFESSLPCCVDSNDHRTVGQS